MPFILATKCNDKMDHELYIKNNSKYDIYVCPTRMFTDTSFYIPVKKIFKGEMQVYDSHIKWEDAFKNSNSKIVSFFFFRDSIIENVPVEEIKNKYLILDRYDIKYEDLDRLNWVLTFPDSNLSYKNKIIVK